MIRKIRICYCFFTNVLLKWFAIARIVKNLPAIQETQARSLGWEDTLEKRMATHSSILASRIPWIEEPGELQSIGLQRAGHSWVTNTCTFYSFSKLVSSLTIQQCTDFIISIIMWRWKDNISLKHTPK